MLPDPILDVRHVTKTYGDVPALRDVSLRVGRGEIICLLGPSGCGKTTLLRVVAGLEHADAGEVVFEGRRIDGVPTHQRGFGLMFQDYALFPHRSVAENVAFGLRMQGMARPAIERRVAELLDLVGLVGYGSRRTDALSGGERQRVALARSLAPNPRLLMLDEPLGALDRALRERLLDELRAILRHVGLTSLYVTHDQAEAFAIGDRLVLMNQGRIEQEGPPEHVYRNPASMFAARFLGFTNLIDATVVAAEGNMLLADTVLGRLHVQAFGFAPGQHVTLVLRPESARLASSPEEGLHNVVNGTIVERLFQGSRTRVAVRMGASAPLEFELDATLPPEIGSHVALLLRPDAISVINAGDTP